MPTVRDIRQTVGEENILDAAYLVVNRLASKCIQRLDLKGIDQTRHPSFLEDNVVGDRIFTAWCLN